ncbi:hypothetical protein NIES4071_72970 [Calothrix sp. NIES-4071]|nr:hypothetical protein NIES4071_72970 [Calothrix sp. NIES-4071]BAZ61572.1 hypothetical protein NIES4105_72920 [Calothrix sp. NIES-4105]
MTTITLQLTPELEKKLQESIARQDASSVRQLLELRIGAYSRSIIK